MTAVAIVLCSLVPSSAPPPRPAVADFILRDSQGKSWRLTNQPRKPVVLVFLNPGCPLARLYAPRLNTLARTYKNRASFAAIFSNQGDSLKDLQQFGQTHSLTIPLLHDPRQLAANRLQARRTPEVFVLDHDRRVRYRGRIDDQYTVGAQQPRATSHDLIDALDATLAGKPIRNPVTDAPGCPITRLARKPMQGITYTRHIAPILQKRCVVCHRKGQSGPFTLTSYRDAANWAGAIREVVADGRMPPWGANPRHGTFANDPSLTATEKKTLFTWIDADCPEGDARDLPPARTFPTGWTIPKPDLVITMPRPFTVPAEGSIEYQYFRVDPGFKEDRWVTAAEIRPGNPAVVHHCNIFLQPPGIDDPEDLRETGQLGSFCFTMTAPGTPPMILPKGYAKRIPAGGRIVFVMHYQSIGSIQTDRTQLALTFADPKTVRKEVATKLMYESELCIPPRAKSHRVSQTWHIQRDVLLLSFFPHLHLRGKSFRYTLVHADGQEEILLDVPRYDFNWQHRYVLKEPRFIKAGSKLRCTAIYDNSPENPHNPDPSATVRTGTQSWEEMFNGYFDVVLADEDLTKPTPWTTRLWRGTQGIFRPGTTFLMCLVGGLFLGRKRIARALGASSSD